MKLLWLAGEFGHFTIITVWHIILYVLTHSFLTSLECGKTLPTLTYSHRTTWTSYGPLKKKNLIYDKDVMLERPPGGATIFWAERRGMWSSICDPEKQQEAFTQNAPQIWMFLSSQINNSPARVNPDWWRFLEPSWIFGHVGPLVVGVGGTDLVIPMTSWTGPS